MRLTKLELWDTLDAVVADLAAQVDREILAALDQTALDHAAMRSTVVRIDRGLDLWAPGGDSSPERFNYDVTVVNEWGTPVSALDMSKYPHTCGCGAPCYDSGFSVKCSSKACKHYEGP